MVGRKEGAGRHFPERSLVESRPAASFPSTGILVSPLNWSGKGRGKKKHSESKAQSLVKLFAGPKAPGRGKE